jgi:hypothetical protein
VDMLTRAEQLGLVLLLVGFIVYVILRTVG